VSTVVSALRARSAVGDQYASTVVGATDCKGVRWCIEYVSTVVSARQCKECGGGSICEHGRQRSRCKECGGKDRICEHGRRRSDCKECHAAKQ